MDMQEPRLRPTDKPRANPLVDLIDTEKEYVNNLKYLLQRVTACWSRDDLPPPELDTMFHHVKKIYVQNKKFSAKLSAIGANPQLAKDIADVLMAWVDDMETPYASYCQAYVPGFDSLVENEQLRQTLAAISAERQEQVSLDRFFMMPLKRLHYYKRFYLRLFRSTEPGRADHQLLAMANQRLDTLIELEQKAVSHTPTPQLAMPVETGYVEPEVEMSNMTSTVGSPREMLSAKTTEQVTLSTWDYDINELESRLDISRIKDLFTKEPKKIKIALQPPSLPFQRDVILHDDFVAIIQYADGPVTHRAHLFLLTDLVLICQPMTSQEKQQHRDKEFWLLYPPLSGKHLAVSKIQDMKEEVLELTVMKRSRVVLRSDIKDIKDKWFRELGQVIKFANAASVKPRVRTEPDLRRNNSSSSQQQSPASGVSDQSSTAGIYSSYTSSSTSSYAKNAGQHVSPPGSLSPHIPDNRLSPPSSGVNPGLPSGPRKGLPASPSSGLSSNVNKALPARPPHVGLPSGTNNGLRARTPEPIRNPGSRYPGGFNPYPSEQGRSSDTDLTRNVQPGSLRRSNSIASIASVSTIATVKETLYQTPPCEVCYWRDNTWIPLTKKDNCLVEIRLTTASKGCWAIILERTNRMVLNAWIHSTTTIHRETPTDVSISCEMGQHMEYYRINTPHPTEADQLVACLNSVKHLRPEPPPQMLAPPTTPHGAPPVPMINTPQMFVSRSSSLQNANEPPREVEQTTTKVTEARCRVFLQNDHGVWTNLNWGGMQLLLETPSHRKRIIISSDKARMKLVDAIVWEDGVERVGRAGIAITLNNVDANVRIVYMMQMKDEKTAVKVFEIMKEKKR